ncbi:polysaccharide deacetylase family protein [Niallia taxi]|uniref:polysaccharide deacetylase family protein n=1 Tax=Niallia taxi TaxID=2499688 RepID=UPI002E250AF0|nr:polysaccharide deacetylase family protein [Niallia taxi]MED4056781.1 polysaccharide deacetylase family protein [Niallia taxi]MED4117304.1 polysaccharide deacetylase family protein [Niallia taxi]
MNKRRLIWTIIIVSVAFLFLFSVYKWMNSRTYQLVGTIVNHVETKEKLVALTFDDGPTGNVDDLLPLLDKYNAKATFFLIGRELKGNLPAAEKIVAAGHQIGNHTYSHNRMVFKSLSFIKEEIETTDALIREAGFEGEIDFRPPNGKKLVGLPYYLNKNDRETITWNLEPDSYYEEPKDKVNYAKENISPGSIILLHPMYDKTGNEYKTTEGILSALTDMGYRFVTINELQEAESR